MNLLELARRLAQAETKEQAQIIFSQYLSGFGFHGFAVTYYAGHIKTGQKILYHYVSKALEPWHLYYLEQNYADVDRTLENIHNSILPVYWDVTVQIQQAKNKREKRIREESFAFGIDKGLSVPVHGPNHDFLSLTLHQFKNERCLHNFELLQYEWLSAAKIYYFYIRKILSLFKRSKSILTKREEQCLTLTAQGWRVEQIAKELKISERTVNFHLQNANKKLGTNNKYQTCNKYFT